MNQTEKLAVDLSIAFERRQAAMNKSEDGDIGTIEDLRETEGFKANEAQNAAMMALVKQGDALRGKG